MLQNIQDKFNASNDFVKHANHFSLFPVDELCEPPLVKNVEVYDLLTPGKEQPLHISLYQMPKKIKKKTSIQINSYRFFLKMIWLRRCRAAVPESAGFAQILMMISFMDRGRLF